MIGGYKLCRYDNLVPTSQDELYKNKAQLSIDMLELLESSTKKYQFITRAWGILEEISKRYNPSPDQTEVSKDVRNYSSLSIKERDMSLLRGDDLLRIIYGVNLFMRDDRGRIFYSAIGDKMRFVIIPSVQARSNIRMDESFDPRSALTYIFGGGLGRVLLPDPMKLKIFFMDSIEDSINTLGSKVENSVRGKVSSVSSIEFHAQIIENVILTEIAIGLKALMDCLRKIEISTEIDKFMVKARCIGPSLFNHLEFRTNLLRPNSVENPEIVADFTTFGNSSFMKINAEIMFFLTSPHISKLSCIRNSEGSIDNSISYDWKTDMSEDINIMCQVMKGKLDDYFIRAISRDFSNINREAEFLENNFADFLKIAHHHVRKFYLHTKGIGSLSILEYLRFAVFADFLTGWNFQNLLNREFISHQGIYQGEYEESDDDDDE